MFGEQSLKLFCVLSFCGFAVARINPDKIDFSAFHKVNISTHLNKAQPFWDPDFCLDFEDLDAFPHPDSCQEYLICWEGELWEMICDEGLLFDPWDLVCDDADSVVCIDDPWPDPEPDPDSECPPPGSTEIVFLPSIYCDEFFICINGQPILMMCRPGQHWNVEMEYCDDPANAGCIDDEAAVPLPDCPAGFTGALPHPQNCNWFIHCSNGNRSIQQCQHLFHFDVIRGQCVFKNAATCIKDQWARLQ